MPYKTIEAAKAANFPTVKEKVDLTLEQINKLAEIFDAIKAGGNADNPMAFAWNAWKNVFKKAGDKWVLAKKGGAESQQNGNWIPVAKAGQPITRVSDGQVMVLTEGALLNAGRSLSGGRVTLNHKVLLPGLEIPETKYEAPFLLMSSENEDIRKLFRESDASGWSIEVDNAIADGNHVINFNGGGISVLYSPHRPACDANMGCSEIFTTFVHDPETGNTADKQPQIKTAIAKMWITLKELTTSISGIKQEQENFKAESEKGGKNEEMDKIEEITKEVVTVKAELGTAKAELGQLTKTHETMIAQSKQKDTELENLKSAHAEELKTVKDKLTIFEAKAEAERKATLEAQWGQLKKEQIPPGLVHKAEDEKKLREQFETNPHAFIMDVVKYDKTGATRQEGEAFATIPDELAKDAKDLEDAADMEGPSYGN